MMVPLRNRSTHAAPTPRGSRSGNARKSLPSNASIAGLLESIAAALEEAKENPFRIRSYRNAAAAIRATRVSLARKVSSGGVDALRTVPGVGEKLAGLIDEFVRTGTVEGIAGAGGTAAPPVARSAAALPAAMILALDEEYRTKAARGELRRIAPRRLNPSGKAWLPIMTLARAGWKFTVMFSNTETAHRLGKTDDWVVVYAARRGAEEQWTVVTETRGRLKGRRVVRGREPECEVHYRDIAPRDET